MFTPMERAFSRALAKTGKPMVVVLVNSKPLVLPPSVKRAAAVDQLLLLKPKPEDIKAGVRPDYVTLRDRLVVATNQNDILHRALTSGGYVTEGVRPSISPSTSPRNRKRRWRTPASSSTSA